MKVIRHWDSNVTVHQDMKAYNATLTRTNAGNATALQPPNSSKRISGK